MTNPKAFPVTRRAFLASSAAASLLATRVHGQAAPRLRAGLIGYGAGGKMLLEAMCNSDSPLSPAAMATHNPNPVDGKNYPVAVESCWQRILERDDLDAVLIAAPDRLHAEMASAALHSGKHVYIMPPFTRTGAEARYLESLAVAQGRVLQVAMEPAESARWQQAQRALSKTGELCWIQASLTSPALTPETHWSRQRAYSHGPAARSLFNMLYPLQHYLELDAPERATALGGVFHGTPDATPDGLLMTLQYPKGLTVVLSHRPEVSGTAHPSCLRGVQDQVALPLTPAPGGYLDDLKNFSSAIAAARCEVQPSLRAARLAQEVVCEAMEQWTRWDSLREV